VPPKRDARGRIAIRALILTPTRELAAQVEESVRTYGKYLPLTSMVMFGGVGMQPQIDRLKKGVDILVATPGRLLDHHGQRTLDLSHVEIFVLDEADRMLDMGFIHDIKKVLAIVPREEAEPALQRHLQRRDQGPGRPAAEPAGADRGGTPQRRPPRPSRRRCTRWAASARRTCWPPDQERRLAPGAGLHAHEARRQPAGRVL
jgi:hypothetical protein